MSTATKIDFFDFIVYSLFGFLAIIALFEVWSWLSNSASEYLRRRRLRRSGVEEEELLPRPNAGFSLKDGSSAVRRHYARDEEGLLIQHGWAQAKHRNPPADSGSRHLREPD